MKLQQGWPRGMVAALRSEKEEKLIEGLLVQVPGLMSQKVVKVGLRAQSDVRCKAVSWDSTKKDRNLPVCPWVRHLAFIMTVSCLHDAVIHSYRQQWINKLQRNDTLPKSHLNNKSHSSLSKTTQAFLMWQVDICQGSRRHIWSFQKLIYIHNDSYLV